MTLRKLAREAIKFTRRKRKGKRGRRSRRNGS